MSNIAPTAASTIKSNPKLYFIIANISKRRNIQSILKAAVAFGVDQILVVGQKKFNFDIQSTSDRRCDVPRQLHHLGKGHFRFHVLQFEFLHECVTYVKDELHARIGGVEIMENALDLETEPFTGDTAIMMGNEGSGMNQKQIDACDFFIKIAQYGDGTASLNVNVAANIVMHRFCMW
eukprot:CAMPEP_0196824638 /NCGR_PEP_ID=MMETSP1362-20130617/92599_1 /TAXON_ID=163516 /ORGANISM="Leptocylindrus danicus, Strain CCMP1856" /LENGTH=177 /DNA_ID=CAMNT_0042204959 /DNA_START=134 /DNA_END=664 /DNA_ORIENTATION=+